MLLKKVFPLDTCRSQAPENCNRGLELQALSRAEFAAQFIYRVYLNLIDCSTAAQKRAYRDEWHKKALEACQGVNLVFLDSDNGLAEKELKPLKRAEKYVYADENVNYYERGQDVVYYCHKGRRKDGAWEKYLLTMKKQLPEAELMAITFHRGTQRSYVFICHPNQAERYRQLLTAFILEWPGLFTPEVGI